ncbi:PTS sugar transporter subunit IIA [Clostridium sp. MB05]
MRRVILATHGELSKGMHNSIKLIIGDMANDIETYSLYIGKSPVDYVNEIRLDVESKEDTEFIFITDIKGGSVHTALMELCVYKNVKLFSGMNMNLVLDILLSFPEEISNKKSEIIISQAREGMTFLDYQSLNADENEEF